MDFKVAGTTEGFTALQVRTQPTEHSTSSVGCTSNDRTEGKPMAEWVEHSTLDQDPRSIPSSRVTLWFLSCGI